MDRDKLSAKSNIRGKVNIEVAATLLLGSSAVSAFHLIFNVFSILSSFSLRLTEIVPLAILSLGFLGSIMIFLHAWNGIYFALAASTSNSILCVFLIMKNYLTTGSTLTLNTLSPLLALIFSLLSFILLFRVGGDINRLETFTPATNELWNETPKKSDYAIETINVTKKYMLGSNVVSALNGLNLKVHRGEFVAIMGPSGSGKSTLLNLLGALDRPTSGKVLIDGVDISKLDEEGLAKLRNEKIGFVFQAYNLIARSTVLRNMELPALVKGYSKEERLRRIHSLLSIVGLEGKALRRPKTLSGGEQQRVAIARALMNDPQIILADEPTGNVDSKTGRVIIGFLRKLNEERGTTVIVVTHDPEVARMADRIVYIRDGRIVNEERLRED